MLTLQLQALQQQEASIKGKSSQSTLGPEALQAIAKTLSEPFTTGPHALESAILNKDSPFRHLNIGFAHHVSKALMDFIRSVYNERLQYYLKKSHLNEQEVATRQRFHSPEEMRYQIVGKHVFQIFEYYLVKDGINFCLKEIEEEIDRSFGSTEAIPKNNDLIERDVGMNGYMLLTNISYNIVQDIVADQAHINGEISPEDYSQEHTGMCLKELLSTITQFVAKEQVRNFKPSKQSDRSAIDVSTIRHTSLSELQKLVHLQEIVRFGKSESDPPPPNLRKNMITREIENAFDRLAYEEAVLQLGQRGISVHKSLLPEDLKFISEERMQVRQFGYDIEGNRMPSDEPDLRLFKMLETRLTEWNRPFLVRGNSESLTKARDEAAARFNQEGGHVAPFPDKIRRLSLES